MGRDARDAAPVEERHPLRTLQLQGRGKVPDTCRMALMCLFPLLWAPRWGRWWTLSAPHVPVVPLGKS